MRIQQVRNATLVIEYGGSRFLIDPMLAEQGAYPGLPGTVNSHLPYPTAALPVPVASLLDVDAVIVTHTHPDHWDEAAAPWCRNTSPCSSSMKPIAPCLLRRASATSACCATRSSRASPAPDHRAARLGRRHRRHRRYPRRGLRRGLRARRRGHAVPTGDTVWNAQVEDNLRRYNPQVVILNAGDARVIGLGAIIMDAQDVWQAYQAAPGATLIASHMEAVNHAVLTRRALREFAIEKGMTDRLRIPEDGEAYRL